MADAMHDDNGYPTWTGLSSVDGVTLVRIKENSATGGMLIDAVTALSGGVVVRTCSKNDSNMVPSRTGVSTSNSNVVVPLYVNPATGAVLVDIL